MDADVLKTLRLVEIERAVRILVQAQVHITFGALEYSVPLAPRHLAPFPHFHDNWPVTNSISPDVLLRNRLNWSSVFLFLHLRLDE